MKLVTQSFPASARSIVEGLLPLVARVVSQKTPNPAKLVMTGGNRKRTGKLCWPAV